MLLCSPPASVELDFTRSPFVLLAHFEWVLQVLGELSPAIFRQKMFSQEV